MIGVAWADKILKTNFKHLRNYIKDYNVQWDINIFLNTH